MGTRFDTFRASSVNALILALREKLDTWSDGSGAGGVVSYGSGLYEWHPGRFHVKRWDGHTHHLARLNGRDLDECVTILSDWILAANGLVHSPFYRRQVFNRCCVALGVPDAALAPRIEGWFRLPGMATLINVAGTEPFLCREHTDDLRLPADCFAGLSVEACADSILRMLGSQINVGRPSQTDVPETPSLAQPLQEKKTPMTNALNDAKTALKAGAKLTAAQKFLDAFEHVLAKKAPELMANPFARKAIRAAAPFLVLIARDQELLQHVPHGTKLVGPAQTALTVESMALWGDLADQIIPLITDVTKELRADPSIAKLFEQDVLVGASEQSE